jgi:F-type H+-transporting ATPase subunit b
LRRYGLPVLLLIFLFAAALAAQHGGEASGEAAGGGSNELLWKWANFAILAGGLGYLAYKKGGAFFRARSEAIRGGIEEADRLRRQAEARVAEVEARLKNLEAEVESLRTQARGEMAAESERLQKDQQTRISKLREHAAELAISLSSARIRSMLSAQVDQGLVLSYLEELERAAAGKSGKELN